MTTQTQRTDLRAIDADIARTRRAIEATEKPVDDAFIAFVIAKHGEQGWVDMQAKTAAWLIEQRDVLAAFEAEREEAGKIACRRCFGDGASPVPTRINVAGKFACFACNGTGLSAAARKARARKSN